MTADPLTISSSLLAATGVVLAAVTCRLTADRRLGWLAVAFGVVGLAHVPFIVGDLHSAPHDPVTTGVRLATVLVLGTAGVGVGWTRRGEHRARTMILAGAASELAAAVVLLAGEAVRLPVLERSFVAWGLLGATSVVLGLMWLAYGVLRTADERARESGDQLRRVLLDLDLMGERDHELRRGLAGIARILLEQPVAAQDGDRVAVSAELARLGGLLGSPPGAGPGR